MKNSQLFCFALVSATLRTIFNVSLFFLNSMRYEIQNILYRITSIVLSRCSVRFYYYINFQVSLLA